MAIDAAVHLSANVANFEREFKRATATLSKFGNQTNFIKSALATFGVGIGGAGILAFAKSSLDAAEALSELSARSGVSVKSLVGFQFAAQQTGASTEDFSKALKFLNKNISESASGDAPALKKLFTDLGMKDAASGAIKAEEALLQLAGVFPRLNDADKIRVSMNLLGKAGESLVPALSGGRGELEKMIATGQKLNPVTQEQAKQADDFNDAVSRLSISLKSSLLPLFDKFLPVLEQFVNNMSGASGKATAFSAAASGIGKVFETVVVLGSEVAFVFKGVGTEIGGMAAQLVSLAKLDFAGFSSIGDAMKADARAAREAQDAFTSSILDAGAKQKQRDAALALLGPGDFGNEGKSKALVTGPQIKLANDKPVKKGSSAKASDPLASIIASTDIAKTQEYNKLLALLSERFKSGSKDAELYAQAVASLNDKFGKTQIDVFDSGAFKTANKDVADFISKQQEAINDLNKGIAEDSANAFKTANDALDSLLAGADFTKLKKDQEDAVLLTLAFTDGIQQADGSLRKLSNSEYLDVMTNRFGLAGKKINEMDNFAKTAADSIQKSFADFLFDPFENGVDGMLKGFGKAIQRMAADAAAAGLAKKLFAGSKDSEGNIDFGKVVTSFFGLFGFAEGGIAAYGKPVALPTFAHGGVSRTAAIFGEAGPEAAVPLPDGRSIPVKMQGGGGDITITNYIDARGADAGMLPRLQAMMDANNKRLKAEILDSRRRNGAFA